MLLQRPLCAAVPKKERMSGPEKKPELRLRPAAAPASAE
jgi:hypothetical protein